MRKILFLSVAAGALFLGSCGNKTQKNDGGEDSAIFADSVVAQLDSMATVIANISDTTKLAGLFSDKTVKLTPDQKKAKIDYLLGKSEIDALTTLRQKYVAMAYIYIDKTVCQLYNDADGDDYYDRALQRMDAETDADNRKIEEKVAKTPMTMENAKKFYEDMKARHRLDKFYVAEAAYIIEALYIISQNVDLYMPCVDDKTAANMTRMLQTVIHGIDLLSVSEPDCQPVVNALKNVSGINATTASQLKEQIIKIKEPLTAARAALLK